MSQASAAQTIAWEVDLLRFSAFPPPSVAFKPAPVWERLVGRPPDEVQERPQQGLRNEVGAIAAYSLFVTQYLNRTDILYGVSPSSSQAAFVTMGNYRDVAEAFLQTTLKWLATAPTLGRLAYAPSLFYRSQRLKKDTSCFTRYYRPYLLTQVIPKM